VQGLKASRIIPGRKNTSRSWGAFKHSRWSRVLLSLLAESSAFGQTYTIRTFAGGAIPVNVLGTSASLIFPTSVAADRTGGVFFAESNLVLRLDTATHILTTVAGNGKAGYSGDNGRATSAQLNAPYGVAIDAAGGLYISDVGNNSIRKVVNGVITTVAGDGTAGFGGDNGAATAAQLNAPYSVAVDATGGLYIADTLNNRVRKVSGGVITTVAGNGSNGLDGIIPGTYNSGPATNATLYLPIGIAVDSAGSIYISADATVFKVADGLITVFAEAANLGIPANPQCLGLGCAQAYYSRFPLGLAVNADGSLLVANALAQVFKVSSGTTTLIAGNGSEGYSGDNGPAARAELYVPAGVAADALGNVYIADSGNNRIRRVSNGSIATMAGSGTISGDNGPAASARLKSPFGVATDGAGNVYIADTLDNSVRRVTNGVITTVAGSGTIGDENGGPATSAALNSPYGVATDSEGNIYIADTQENRVRKVAKGITTIVAGTGGQGFSGDRGPAVSAELNWPMGVAVDAAGNIYIADTGNHRIRIITNGVIATAAGDGAEGYTGDNVSATSTALFYPQGVAVDSAGTFYIADEGNNRVRKVANGVITTVAGNGEKGFGGDNGPATMAELYFPSGIAVDAFGSIYIGDSFNNRIRRITRGVITTIAGNGAAGYGGDNGPATSAELYRPMGLALDSEGNLYIADPGNNVIRVLTAKRTEGRVSQR
jgi:sugar lactone lactonase YvrE